MGTVWSWPNQQVVRADQSGPGVNTPPPGLMAAEAETEASAETAEANPLDAMTKAELLAYAQESGVPPPMNNDMTKEEIRAAIDAHEGR